MTCRVHLPRREGSPLPPEQLENSVLALTLTALDLP